MGQRAKAMAAREARVNGRVAIRPNREWEGPLNYNPLDGSLLRWPVSPEMEEFLNTFQAIDDAGLLPQFEEMCIKFATASIGAQLAHPPVKWFTGYD